MSSARSLRWIKDVVHPTFLVKQRSRSSQNYITSRSFNTSTCYKDELDVSPSSSTIADIPSPSTSPLRTLSDTLSTPLTPREPQVAEILTVDPSDSTPKEEHLKFLEGKRGINKTILKKINFRNFEERHLGLIRQIFNGNDYYIDSSDSPSIETMYLAPVISRHLCWATPKHSAKIIIIAPGYERVEALAQYLYNVVDKVSGIGATKLGCRRKFGQKFRQEADNLLDEKNDIIITTPGRFLTHLLSTPGFKELLIDLKCVIWDNVHEYEPQNTELKDQALVIRNIIGDRPLRKNYQTLVVSNKHERWIHDIAIRVLRPGFVTVQPGGETTTVRPSELSRISHESVVHLQERLQKQKLERDKAEADADAEAKAKADAELHSSRVSALLRAKRKAEQKAKREVKQEAQKAEA